jgi:hypothetical protein
VSVTPEQSAKALSDCFGSDALLHAESLHTDRKRAWEAAMDARDKALEAYQDAVAGAKAAQAVWSFTGSVARLLEAQRESTVTHYRESGYRCACDEHTDSVRHSDDPALVSCAECRSVLAQLDELNETEELVSA